jgi:hypothetical protein
MWSGGRTTSFNEGSGVQKLLGFRAKWYAENIHPQLEEMIDGSLHELAGYEDEFYSRAYGFLKKYINPKTGTIHFYDTSASEGVSLSPFSAGDDTSLSWKTQDLYYIKKQQIPQPMAVPVGETGKQIQFEIGNIDSYLTDGRDLIYVYKGATKAGISILVEATTKGKKTKVENIAKAAKKEGMEIPIDVINRAINDFKSQTNVDFFINKDAGKFLQNRLNEESGAKLVSEIDHTDENLIRREQFYRKVMGMIIDLCAQFEDELLRIWLKPKFVHNSHYVITLDKIAENTELLGKIVAHENMTKFQVPLWNTLGIVEEAFYFQDILEGGALKDEFQYLPIDTMHFPDLLHEILDSAFDSIDEELNGWLIHADNFAALNNIKDKFSKRIQTAYQDPPFNTGSDDNFEYMDKFQDSTWLTMMENRLDLTREMMHSDGAIFLHLDHNANHLGKKLLSQIFGKDRRRNDIIWKYGKMSSSSNKLKSNHDNIYYWAMSENTPHNTPKLEFANQQKNLARELKDGKLVNKRDPDTGELVYVTSTETELDNVWGAANKDPRRVVKHTYLKPEHRDKFANDTPVISYHDSDVVTVQPASAESLGFGTQKPELLPARIFEMTSNPNDIVMDINLGSGTSAAAAHKIGRRWIGVEMGHNFKYAYQDNKGGHCIGILGRMAQVLAAKGKKMDPKSGEPMPANSEPTKLSQKVDWSGGGAFKYYSLENHEDVLHRANYAEGVEIDVSEGIPPYLFHSDPKLVEEGVNPETGMLALESLYGEGHNQIDLSETISQVLGLKIKSIASDSVTLLRNGEEDYVINFKEIPVEIWKPLLWWGETS